jgi:hypothetical protein
LVQNPSAPQIHAATVRPRSLCRSRPSEDRYSGDLYNPGSWSNATLPCPLDVRFPSLPQPPPDVNNSIWSGATCKRSVAPLGPKARSCTSYIACEQARLAGKRSLLGYSRFTVPPFPAGTASSTVLTLRFPTPTCLPQSCPIAQRACRLCRERLRPSRIHARHHAHQRRLQKPGTSTRSKRDRTQGEEIEPHSLLPRSATQLPQMSARGPVHQPPLQGRAMISSFVMLLSSHRKQSLLAKAANSLSRTPQVSANVARRLSFCHHLLASLLHL